MSEEFIAFRGKLSGKEPWIYADFCALTEDELLELFAQCSPELDLQEKGKFRRLYNAGRGICQLFILHPF